MMAADWQAFYAAQAAKLTLLKGEIAAGRIAGFDASDKGENAIVEAGGATCTGNLGGGQWSVACGEPIGGGGAEDRAAYKVTKAGAIGVISSTASREVQLGQHLCKCGQLSEHR